jgi:hypothetical protein
LTDPLTPAQRASGAAAALGEPVVRNAVIHLNNEQPVVADLFEFPTARDVAVVCTNMRTQDGKRPVFIDQASSIFVIPLAYVRFIELPRDAGQDGGETGPGGVRSRPAAAPAEAEIEIDEEFLRRIRDA